MHQNVSINTDFFSPAFYPLFVAIFLGPVYSFKLPKQVKLTGLILKAECSLGGAKDAFGRLVNDPNLRTYYFELIEITAKTTAALLSQPLHRDQCFGFVSNQSYPSGRITCSSGQPI